MNGQARSCHLCCLHCLRFLMAVSLNQTSYDDLAASALQFLVLQPKVDRGEPEGEGLKTLIRDPYIIVAAGAITIGNLGIAILEPSLPLWLMESFGASSIERGAAFLPASVSYLIGTNM